MLVRDAITLVGGSVRSQTMRSGLTALGIAVGIATVILLTAIGEGLQRYVINEFTQFGTRVIAINPGAQSTFGVSGGVFGSVRPLSIQDGEALKRIPGVTAVTPAIQGNARVEAGQRNRRTEVLGVGASMPEVFSFEVSTGAFLPNDDPRSARPFAVLGSTLKRELFGTRSPLGEFVRIGANRFRVIGVMVEKGQILGVDIDNVIYIPAARALELFNREGLMEIDVVYSETAAPDRVAAAIKRMLLDRHGGEDFTITTQTQMLDVLGGILGVLTGAVAALGGISLVVGGIGILTIMTIAVNERTHEIGLLRAIGAPRRQVLSLFLGEAVLLASFGGMLGLVSGGALTWLLSIWMPARVSVFYAALALILSMLIGLIAGVVPASRAANLDPLEALRAE